MCKDFNFKGFDLTFNKISDTEYRAEYAGFEYRFICNHYLAWGHTWRDVWYLVIFKDGRQLCQPLEVIDVDTKRVEIGDADGLVWEESSWDRYRNNKDDYFFLGDYHFVPSAEVLHLVIAHGMRMDGRALCLRLWRKDDLAFYANILLSIQGVLEVGMGLQALLYHVVDEDTMCDENFRGDKSIEKVYFNYVKKLMKMDWDMECQMEKALDLSFYNVESYLRTYSPLKKFVDDRLKDLGEYVTGLSPNMTLQWAVLGLMQESLKYAGKFVIFDWGGTDDLMDDLIRSTPESKCRQYAEEGLPEDWMKAESMAVFDHDIGRSMAQFTKCLGKRLYP